MGVCFSQSSSDGAASKRKSRHRPAKASDITSSSIMDGKGPLSQDAAFQALQKHFDGEGKAVDIAQQFASDPKRFDKFR